MDVKKQPVQGSEEPMPKNNETRNLPKDGEGPGFKRVTVAGTGEGSGNANTTQGIGS